MVETKEQKPIAEITEPKRGSVMLFSVSVLILLVVAGFSVFWNLQRNSLTEEQKRLDTEVAALNTEIDTIKSQNIEGARIAQNYLEAIESSEIRWSKIIEAINDLIPKDDKTGKPIISVLSYNGSENGKIGISMQSTAGKTATFENVARAIESFNTAGFFQNPIVPSIARGEDDNGNVLLSFTLNTYYQEKANASLLTGSSDTSDTGDGTASAGVSRANQ